MSDIKFEPVIGIEIHVQIGTKSKMFCACSNDSWCAQPNTNVCPICMGFPGMLPVINREALRRGVLTALALNCEIKNFSKFDRKNYFYPDLPKGFQISQFDKPLSRNGYVDIFIDGKKKRIGVHRLHLEDDAGKLIHTQGGTLCDYNRTGSPLMEIVSEPDMNSAREASLYAQEIRRIVRYTGASDCDMEKGMMRFDINISLRKRSQKEFGIRTEVKNLNSFRALERALEYEIKRQNDLLEKGERVVQDTRGWDDAAGKTVLQRSKEESHDYRYFPEPDLPPIVMDTHEVEKLKSEIPELPLARQMRFIEEFGISEKDAGILVEDREMADFFEEVVKASSGDAKKAGSFINTILLKYLHRDNAELKDCKIKARQLGALIKMINDGVISNNMAKTEVFEEMYAAGRDPEKIVEKKGLKMESDSSAIEENCKKVIAENAASVSDFKNGKDRALGFLVGQVMKRSSGKANPKQVNEILKKLLA